MEEERLIEIHHQEVQNKQQKAWYDCHMSGLSSLKDGEVEYYLTFPRVHTYN
jgi:hypothetical protein